MRSGSQQEYFDASQGAKSQADAFKSLGVSVTDSNGNLRSADSVLLDIADRFAESADGADKTAIAMRVFGESGRTLIPLLNSGSDGIEQLTHAPKNLDSSLIPTPPKALSVSTII